MKVKNLGMKHLVLFVLLPAFLIVLCAALCRAEIRQYRGSSYSIQPYRPVPYRPVPYRPVPYRPTYYSRGVVNPRAFDSVYVPRKGGYAEVRYYHGSSVAPYVPLYPTIRRTR